MGNMTIVLHHAGFRVTFTLHPQGYPQKLWITSGEQSRTGSPGRGVPDKKFRTGYPRQEVTDSMSRKGSPRQAAGANSIHINQRQQFNSANPQMPC